jgi:enamine deaminase RidA (YjgF/YER057c/UK114 family)
LSAHHHVVAACGGDFGRVVRAVKLTGFVNSTPGFTDQPKVVNGCSDFLVEVMGDAGRHARSAVSAASLPLGVAVEVEGVGNAVIVGVNTSIWVFNNYNAAITSVTMCNTCTNT